MPDMLARSTRVFYLCLLASALCFGQDRTQRISTAADTLRAKVIAQRRDFHQHPELSNREERTARVIAEKLRALGLDDVKTGVGKHGIVALIKGAKPGGVVAWRADMDALPVTANITAPYKSENPGVHHACGHDAHMAIALGVAEVLSKMRDQIAGTVKFIFQPAEEGAPVGEEGGAALMIKEGALEKPAAFRHLWPPRLEPRACRNDSILLRTGTGLRRHFRDLDPRQTGPCRQPESRDRPDRGFRVLHHGAADRAQPPHRPQ